MRNTRPLQIQLGLGNAWKLGHLVPVRMQLNDSLRDQATGVEVQSIDGDGVETTIAGAFERKHSGYRRALVADPVQARQAADLTFTVLGPEGALHTQSFDTGQSSQALPSSQPLVVALGASMGIVARA